ncbi:hypothetical protein Slin14017_G036930 [Septoria linicola]|nr:hypothetical protein Slin14017_G036930 [Septoria linicola]
MAGTTGVYWLTPTWMVASLLTGIAFAIAHHFFYQSLDQTTAPTTDDYYSVAGSHMAKQQFNTAVGTAFAFLVKASLVFAVSSAYFQTALHVAKRGRQVLTIGNMDVLLSALGNAISLGNAKFWWRQPMLFLIALIIWLIPIASIVTPATLSVGIRIPSSREVQVPDIALQSLKLVADMRRASPSSTSWNCSNSGPSSSGDAENCQISAEYTYDGPGSTVRRIAQATAAQGAILAVEAPAPNSSWTMSFSGPHLSCQPVTEVTERIFQESIANYSFGLNTSGTCRNAPGYIAWSPPTCASCEINDEEVDARRVAPFTQPRASRTADVNSWVLNSWRYTDRFQSAPQSFYMFASVAPMQRYPEIMGSRACMIRDENITFTQKASKLVRSPETSMLRCDLYNATYKLDFEFINGAQTVTTQISEVDTEPVEFAHNVRGMAAESLDHTRCDMLSLRDTPFNELDCTLDTRVLQSLSYQAIMDSFTELLHGLVYIAYNAEDGENVVSNSSAPSTILVETKELNFLRNASAYLLDLTEEMYAKLGGPRKGQWQSLQEIKPSWGDSLFRGLGPASESSLDLPLSEALEQLFQNITISMMSSPLLQSDNSSAFRPAPVEVTFGMRENVYEYAQEKLWLAYGLAIGTSCAIVILGLLIIYLHGAAFEDEFSTCLRLSRCAIIDAEIREQDYNGSAPLPGYVKKMQIRFPEGSEASSVKRGTYEAVATESEQQYDQVPIPSHTSIGSVSTLADHGPVGHDTLAGQHERTALVNDHTGLVQEQVVLAS